MGYITVSNETEYDIFIEDIMDNLNQFDSDELEELRDGIDFTLEIGLGKRNKKKLEASTLDEEYKIGILKELFDKFSWEELEIIKKKII